MKIEATGDAAGAAALSVPNFVNQAGLQAELQERLNRNGEEGQPSSTQLHTEPVKRKIEIKTEEVPAPASLKRRRYFRDEELELQCEWGDCTAAPVKRMEDFMRHCGGHVVEAAVERRPEPLPDQFGCLWRDCGFTSPSSEEMVRHIHFHR